LGKGLDQPLTDEQDCAALGGGYDMDTLAETAVVKGYGVKAVAIPLVDGYSTTTLVKKIRQPTV
jgi:D-glycero-beta-D-manno-heptose 1-phosphate adenylyltransferase